MAALIFDASGIVKRYLVEAGTAWVQDLADPAAANEIFLTRITRVEVTAAVTRRGRGGAFLASAMLRQFRHDALHQYNIVEITSDILNEAERLAEAHALRGYDAVQLSASLELHRLRQSSGLAAITLISADDELNDAARAEGLAVDDPKLHP